MQTYTQKLLERLRKIADPPTDYQMAKMLGVERQNVHNWLKRGSGMDLVTAYTLADLLHEDRSIIAGMVELDKANLSPEKKARLEHMLPRLVASTSVAFLACLAASITTPGRAHALTRQGEAVDVSRELVTNQEVGEVTPIYIMRTLIRALARRFAACRQRFGRLIPWQASRQLAYAS